jgi:murein L,D-transpeptidase YafK
MSKIKITFISFVILFIGLTIYYFYPEDKLPKGIKIDKMIVYKSKRKLLAYSNDKLIKTYKIALGRQPIGAKQYQGDRKTPEGIYYINDKNPNSVCYKNVGISYPNKKDIEKAKALGKPTGGDIKIHGLPNRLGFIGKFFRRVDWTNGCIAVTDKEMEELYHAIKMGAQIEIKP